MRTSVLLAIAIAIAASTAFAVKGRISSTAPQESAQPAIPAARVLIARVDIPAGSFIRSDKDLDWVSFPVENIPDAYIKEGQQDMTTFDGAVARNNITAGEPITNARVVKPDDGGFMSAVLTPGMRAVSIAVNATTGNAGFIFPGDKVDLILTHKITDQDEGRAPVSASETFIEGVRVLAVDQRFNSKDKEEVLLARTVTLEVSPKQAEKINVASDLGRISLSLRSLAIQNQTANADTDADNAGTINTARTDDTYTSDREVSRLLRSMRRSGDTVRVSVSRGGAAEDVEFERR